MGLDFSLFFTIQIRYWAGVEGKIVLGTNYMQKYVRLLTKSKFYHALKPDCQWKISIVCAPGVDGHFGPAVPLVQVHAPLLWRKVWSGCSEAKGKSLHWLTATRFGYQIHLYACLQRRTTRPSFSREAESRGTCLGAVCLNPNNFSTQRKIRNCRYSLFHLLYLYHASAAEISKQGIFLYHKPRSVGASD